MQEGIKYSMLASLTPGFNLWSFANNEPIKPVHQLVDEAYFPKQWSPDDETAWAKVSTLFPRPKGFTQLENGYFSQTALPVRAFHQERENYIQNRSSFFMRKEQDEVVESSRGAIAKFLGWPAETITLTRNTTESLNIMILGFPWKSGDEVIIGDQDYFSMNEAFQLAAKRFGIVIKVAKIPLHPKSDQEVVDAYMKHWTGKTRMLHLTHLINLSGQVIPMKPIVSAARAKNSDVFIAVDAAHSVAHIETDWANLDIDGMGASLHKWLSVPLGVGVMYVKENRIPQLWPLFADTGHDKHDIRRFEHQGTKPIQSLACIAEAVKLVDAMGGVEARHKRLHYLQNTWTSEARNLDTIEINTPEGISRSGAIANVRHKSLTPDQLAEKLWDEHEIFSVAINHDIIKGVRITPYFSNTIEDVQLLLQALKSMD